MAIEDVGGYVEFAVVEEVSDCKASADDYPCETCAFNGRDEFELLAFEVAEEEGALGEGGSPGHLVDGGVGVAVGDDDVLPAVVVVVEEGGAPGEEGDGWFGDAHLIADVGEVGAAVVAVEGVVVVGEGGVVEVEEAVVLVVADGYSHGGGLAAVLVEGVSGGVAGVFEGAVAF